MRRVLMIALCVGLAGCKPAGDPGNELVLVDIGPNAAPEDENGVAPGPYVPGRGEHPGENEMRTAIPDQYYYRDLPAALGLRGDWTVLKAAWFAVSGSETVARSPARIAAFEGARIRIDRLRIVVTPRDPKPLADVTLDCSDVGYLDKSRLTASEHEGDGSPVSREDAVVMSGIAVAEREIASAFANSSIMKGEVLSLICPRSDTGDAEAGEYPIAYITGAMVIDERRMVLIFSDGTTIFAERDAQ